MRIKYEATEIVLKKLKKREIPTQFNKKSKNIFESE